VARNAFVIGSAKYLLCTVTEKQKIVSCGYFINKSGFVVVYKNILIRNI
jgi:hypothetical protein